MSKNSSASLPRQVGDRHDLPLFPEQPVRKARDVAHVDAGADHAAALAHRLQRRRHQRADRRKDDGGVERLRRRFVGAAGPVAHRGCRAKAGRRRRRARTKADTSRPCQRRHLGDDVGGGAEAVEAEPPAVAGDPRASASRSGRRRAAARVATSSPASASAKAIARIGHRMGGVAAVAGVAGEQRPVAEVLAALLRQ